jgi:type I restriction enzyme, S subunit
MASNGAITTPTGAHIMVARQSSLLRRGDPRYIRLTFEMATRYASPCYRLVPLRDLLVEPISYGTSTRLASEPPGYPVLRMNNLTADGWDTSETKYLGCTKQEAAPLTLKQGDILINRTNSDELVGKVAVFNLAGDWLYASYLLRAVLDTTRADPQFVSHFLNSPAGRLEVTRASRRAIGMANINPEEIGSFLIPLPDLATQQQLLKPLHGAWQERSVKDAASIAELLAINNDVAYAIKAPPLVGAPAVTYATSQRQAQRIDRLGAQLFHPERAAALDAVIAAANATAVRLEDAAEFVSDPVEPSEAEMVLGLSAIEPHTGEVASVVDTAAAAKRYQSGDVIYSRLRPYLNKVARMSVDGLCSTEFYVLRALDGVDPDYLAVALRSPLVLSQARHLSTGNTHPRVVEADARGIVVPLPSAQIQRRVAAAFAKRRKKAQRLRNDAETDWTKALEKFGQALLG